ncbi:uncharacterized protein [Fopius arisanus]|uniref:Uncharacterized protein n=1 Tax=Fopius arisanus TaxID=64838 RepID=A0A9R1TS84_9HYME|nr:PREDICTED: uncharacterized protein LOC105273516 [Fopius arisanus]
MTKVVCTIWSLVLYLSGISIFQPFLCNCVTDNEEEDEGNFTGPKLTCSIFVIGVYIITSNISLLPSSYRRPAASVLCVYEFFATSFILDFAGTCVWTPINVMIMTTLPKAICHTLNRLDYDDAAEWIVSNQLPMMTMSFGMSIGSCLAAIHTTRALDLTMYNECGVLEFAEYVKNRFWQRIISEFRTTSNKNERHLHKSAIQRHQSCVRTPSRRRHRSRSRGRIP